MMNEINTDKLEVKNTSQGAELPHLGRIFLLGYLMLWLQQFHQ
ncbi:hypothetical protein [Spiroplasma clarkii]|nr:hypothetical protein [Spiroplasma clarkii]